MEFDRHEEGVAVGRSLGCGLRGDDGVGAGPVLDHHGLAPVLAHLLPDEARDDVRRPARGERHDQANRPAGEARGGLLRERRGGCRERDERGEEQ